MSTPIVIHIVGGGIASLVAGIELRDRLPKAKIRIVSAAPEELLGGQLASWDAKGYPIEHGLHALFGFYQHLLPLLQRVGAESNFTRSRKHIYVHERGKFHRFDLRFWIATYTGFTHLEKLRMGAFLPKLAQIVAEVSRKGYDVLDQYDDLDLRDFFRKNGFPVSVVKSSFFQQLYDAPFNGPEPMSAAVGLESLYRIFSKPWHYYFKLPSREAIIVPLLNYFLKQGGEIEYRKQVTGVVLSGDGARIESLSAQDLSTGGNCKIQGDEFVFATGLDDFKTIDFGTAAKLPYFKNIHKLESVSSVALQIWFKEDPVPAKIDSLINGLPEPFSILCPLTRVRKAPVADLPLPYEIAATGPEAGFEDVSDEKLIETFLKTVGKLGFKIPENRDEMHISLRRNREPHHRYLLTRPGQLGLRPQAQSPIENLTLAGAWVRNSLALPCADAAAESGIRAAELIAERARIRSARDHVFLGMPRGHALVIQPPFEFPDSTASVFVVRVNPEQLAREIAPGLRVVKGLEDRMLLSYLEHRGVFSPADPSESVYRYHEVVLSAFVKEEGASLLKGYGLFPIAVYLDNDTATAAGREVYGFPKKMAELTLIEGRPCQLRISRPGRTPGEGRGEVHPIEILRGQWEGGDSSSAGDSVFSEVFSSLGGVAHGTLEQVLGLPFYTWRELVAPVASSSGRSAFRELMALPVSDIRVKSSKLLKGGIFELSPSANDPLHLLAPDPALRLQASRGLKIEFSFAMRDARIVEGRT